MIIYTPSSQTGLRFFVGITGLVNGDFTKTLYRNQTTSSAETVTVTEDSAGWYYATFTPTTATAHYELGIQYQNYVIKENYFDAASFKANVSGLSTHSAADVLGVICETEGSYTAQEILSVLLSVIAGRTTSNGLTFKTPNNVANRVVATVDASNNRTAITLTPSA